MRTELEPPMFFALHGLVVRCTGSEFSESVGSSIPSNEIYDIAIEYGKVPTSLPGSAFHAFAEICDNQALLNFREHGRILVEYGSRVVVRSGDTRDSAYLHAHLSGSALALAMMQRGRVLLHASCMEKDGKAICFLGETGAGKSTAADSLLEAGFRLIADDVIAPVVRDGKVYVYPASSGLRLDAPDGTAGGSVDSVSHTSHWQGKVAQPVHQIAENRAYELRHVIILNWCLGYKNTVEIQPLQGFDAFQRIYEQIFRLEFVKAAGLESENREMIGKLTASTCVSSVSRPRDKREIFRFVEGVVELMERDHGSFNL